MGVRPGRTAGGPYRARSASLGGLGVKPPEKSPRPGVWQLPMYGYGVADVRVYVGAVYTIRIPSAV